MVLSIVIPAYEEARKIAGDVAAAAAFLAGQRLQGEVIVSDDGSRDDTVQHARAAPMPPGVMLRVLCSRGHRGKGAAVRAGIAASHGEYVMFADAGLTVPYDVALRGLELIRTGTCELAHGSRKLPGSVIRVPQQADRKLFSLLFRTVLHLLLPVPHDLTDTQCGFKVYQGDVARMLCAACVADGFLFDVEMAIRAQRHGFRVREFPVDWRCDRDSRIAVHRSAWPILREILRVRRALSRLQPARAD